MNNQPMRICSHCEAPLKDSINGTKCLNCAFYNYKPICLGCKTNNTRSKLGLCKECITEYKNYIQTHPNCSLSARYSQILASKK